MPVGKNAKTFQNELHLPSIVLPKFKDVLNYYFEILLPLLDQHVYHNYHSQIFSMLVDSAGLIDEYMKTRTQNQRNFLEHWWLKTNYLNKNSQMIPFNCLVGLSGLNYRNLWPLENESYISRGAQYLRAILMFWICLRHEIIRPDRSDTDEPLSMNNYRYAFNNGRLPTDCPRSRFATFCEKNVPSAVLICIKGYVFEVDLLEDEIVWPLEKIKDTLVELFQSVLDKESMNNVTPIMTQKPTIFQHTLKFANIKHQFFKSVRHSILWLSFDSESPKFNNQNIIRSLITSDCQNRCPSKSLSIVVYENGLVGLYADPALVDIDILKNIIDFADTHIMGSAEDETKANDYPIDYTYKSGMRLMENNWMMYDLRVPSDLNIELETMRRVFSYNSYHLDGSWTEFKWFTADFAKKWQIDPCITVHLLILLTYYSINGYLMPSCAYISQRRYFHGRMECVPTGVLEVYSWVKAVEAKKCPPTTLKNLFMAAHKKLEKAFQFCESNVGPVTYINYLKDQQDIVDMSDGLKRLVSDQIFIKSGFAGHFYINTHYLGNTHTVIVPKCDLENSISFSYSIDDISTNLCMICRDTDEEFQSNRINPQLFMSEFIPSVELLNQMFFSQHG